jgi:hypothetical protein
VPSPLVPRAVTPRLFVSGEVVAVAAAELPRPNDTGEAGEEVFALGAVVAAEFAEFRVPVTPELLLTELQGGDAVLAAPTPEVVKPVVGLSPPLDGLSPPSSNGDRATAPRPPLVQGAGLATSVNGAGVVWELSPGGWPKSDPSGDVGPMLPELDVPVCAALGELPSTWPKSAPSGDVGPMLGRVDVVPVCAAPWPTASAVMISITAAARKGFIGMTVRQRCEMRSNMT